MTDFTATIDNQVQLDGLTFTREQYNEANPQNQLNSDQDYFDFIVSSLFNQWAQAKKDADLAEALAALANGDSSLIIAIAEST